MKHREQGEVGKEEKEGTEDTGDGGQRKVERVVTKESTERRRD